jgi:hypothetical protein
MKVPGNNSKLYLGTALVFLFATLLLAALLSFNRFVEQPAIASSLEKGKDNPSVCVEAYLKLRNPHIFAGYDRFDSKGRAVVTIIRYFDRLLYEGKTPEKGCDRYLEFLFNRWKAGVHLTAVTLTYTGSIALIALLLFFIELKRREGES